MTRRHAANLLALAAVLAGTAALAALALACQPLALALGLGGCTAWGLAEIMSPVEE